MATMYIVALGILSAGIAADAAQVSFQHGGELLGTTFEYDGKNIDIFLGVPYAEPPTGPLRFQKTRPARPWTGVKDATDPGNLCPQMDLFTGSIIGNEDCLLLDITVPGGVDSANKKPVMVWIHGGGYIGGSKNEYAGAVLASHGDVIVISINYRLSVMGFLADGPGTGNFGLWDQRTALLWVQENIALFGGDPEKVTIFGESAGAGSVSAQMMGQHNDGLFKRAIQESGTLFSDWGWFLSERRQHDIVKDIKQKGSCPPTQSVYDCLREKTTEEIFASVPPVDYSDNIFHPVPDRDFFSSDAAAENYEPTRRFDLMAGFNEQEAVFNVLLPLFSNKTTESIENGVSRGYADLLLDGFCGLLTPKSVILCKSFYMKTYGLDIVDDKQRGVSLSFALGELSFNADTVRQLSVHSDSSATSTYAYQFSELYKSDSDLLPVNTPAWLKVSATHVDEIPFVFGGAYIKENSIIRESYKTASLGNSTQAFSNFMDGLNDSEKPLTDLIITAWTNFAKSGNPNTPTPLPGSAPTWPQFNTVSNNFIEFKNSTAQVITTPNKERLEKVLNTIFKDRTTQQSADIVQEGTCGTPVVDGQDTVIG